MLALALDEKWNARAHRRPAGMRAAAGPATRPTGQPPCRSSAFGGQCDRCPALPLPATCLDFESSAENCRVARRPVRSPSETLPSRRAAWSLGERYVEGSRRRPANRLPVTTDRKVGGSPPGSLDEAVLAAEPPKLLCGRALAVEEREIKPPRVQGRCRPRPRAGPTRPPPPARREGCASSRATR